MDIGLKEKIMTNRFIEKVRNQMQIDEQQYTELCELLEKLAIEWKNKKDVDKELVLFLYNAPQIIRNIFLSFKEKGEPLPDIANRLEDIWVELDALVIECLS